MSNFDVPITVPRFKAGFIKKDDWLVATRPVSVYDDGPITALGSRCWFFKRRILYKGTLWRSAWCSTLIVGADDYIPVAVLQRSDNCRNVSLSCRWDYIIMGKCNISSFTAGFPTFSVFREYFFLTHIAVVVLRSIRIVITRRPIIRLHSNCVTCTHGALCCRRGIVASHETFTTER